MRTMRNVSIMVRFFDAALRKAQPLLWIVLFVIAAVRPHYAQDPMVCLAGANDGKTCTVPANCPGGTCTANDVRAYANGCYSRLNIKEAAFAGPFKCKDGNQLFTKEAGVTKDINIRGVANPPPNAAAGFPPTCDKPTWLPNGGDQCYGNSYVQKIKVTENVQAVLLCRHKNAWTDGDKDFHDIAMILNNKENGETCWFQTADRDACVGTCAGGAGGMCGKDADCPGSTCTPAKPHCDGTKVPAPHTAEAQSFYLTPTATAKINCVRCHDNGPWMNSRWMNDAIELKDGHGKYVNNGYGFSTPANVATPLALPLMKAWAPTSFVTIARSGLPVGKGKACTSCHEIHSKEVTPDPAPAFGNRNYQTYENWLDYSIGKSYPPNSNATGQAFGIAYWMPAPHGQPDATAWDAIYKDHIDKLRACMAAKGVGVKDCEPYVAQLNINPAGAPGARILASLDGGRTFPFLSEATSPPTLSDTIVIAPPSPSSPPTRLTLRWEASSNYISCAIEATFPEGVASSTGVETATNWGLPDSPQDIGELTAPGEYRFDLYCDDDFGGNLIFQIPSPTPTPSPTPFPTPSPTPFPTPSPTPFPTPSPTPFPTPSPTPFPTPSPTPFPTPSPTPFPTPSPTPFPTPSPTPFPTPSPTPFPTASPTPFPTPSPTPFPTPSPTPFPTPSPTPFPTPSPTPFPTPTPLPTPTATPFSTPSPISTASQTRSKTAMTTGLSALDRIGLSEKSATPLLQTHWKMQGQLWNWGNLAWMSSPPKPLCTSHLLWRAHEVWLLMARDKPEPHRAS